MSAAETLEFERAKEYRDQISHIEQVMEKQKMTMNDFTNQRYIWFAVDKGWMCVQVFFIRQGKLIERDVSLFPIYQGSGRRIYYVFRSILCEIRTY